MLRDWASKDKPKPAGGRGRGGGAAPILCLPMRGLGSSDGRAILLQPPSMARTMAKCDCASKKSSGQVDGAASTQGQCQEDRSTAYAS